MKFLILAIFIALPIWALCQKPVRQMLGEVPSSVWLTLVTALSVAAALFIAAYGGESIRFF